MLSTSAILFTENPYVIAGAAAVSILLFFCAENPSWRAIQLIVVPTTLLYFGGNLLFSPSDKGGSGFLIFWVNSYGLHSAVIRALRICVVLLISLAWLGSTPIVEIYASLVPIRPIRPWVLGICRTLQLTKREFVAIGQSLKIRGMRFASMSAVIRHGNWLQLRRNVNVFLALVRVIVSNQFPRIARATLAWERHHPVSYGSVPKDKEIIVRDVFVRYRRDLEPCIQHSSFSVDGNSVVYITGSAGAGKSTILRALGGIIPRVVGELAGEIRISGIDTAPLTLKDYPSLATYCDGDMESNILGLTVGQEMMLLTSSESESRSALTVMGIADLWERETTKLSGGQQVRLLLAGILTSKAGVIVLDDPLEQLDPTGREDFLAALTKLLAKGSRTIIFADRHHEAFRSLISKVLAIEERQVKKLTTSDSLQSPANLKRWGLEDLRGPIERKPCVNTSIVASMENVYVAFDGTPILKGVDLHIGKGELLVIRGPNGSGKTTAMLALAGVVPITRGNIEAPKRIGYVFQDASAQIVAPSVFEELAISPRLQGLPEREVERVVSAILADIQIQGSKPPQELHPQELKMVAIQAMGIGVDLVILDEPSVGLDSAGIKKVIEFIRTKQASGTAAVVISHEEVFLTIADRIMEFDNGRCSGWAASASYGG